MTTKRFYIILAAASTYIQAGRLRAEVHVATAVYKTDTLPTIQGEEAEYE